MAAIKNLRNEAIADLVACPSVGENLGVLGKLQGMIDACNQVLSTEVFENLPRGNEENVTNE